MLRHYVDAVLPNGFKAQVVATSRLAAVRYRDAFLAARDELVGRAGRASTRSFGPLTAADRTRPAAGQDGAAGARLAAPRPASRGSSSCRSSPASTTTTRAGRSGPTRPGQDAASSKRSRSPSCSDDDDRRQTSPSRFLIVKSMLLTGFDAPIEQVLYLDRPIKEAELLQAIARVNRTAANKQAGFVVDYFGVAEHLKEALAAYAAEDIEGALTSIADEIPMLRDRHQRVRSLFLRARASTGSTASDEDACVEALADERLRAAFEVALKQFTASLDIVLPRPEALPYVADAKLFGLIAFAARSRYRDNIGFDASLYGGEGPQAHRRPRRGARHRPEDPAGLDHRRRISTPRSAGLRSDRAKASEMEHAIRYHIREHFDEDPEHYGRSVRAARRRSSRSLGSSGSSSLLALADLLPQVRAGRQADDSGLDPQYRGTLLRPAQTRTHRRRKAALKADRGRLARVDHRHLVRQIWAEIGLVGFWHNAHAQNSCAAG